MMYKCTFVVRKPYDPVERVPSDVGEVVENEFRLKRDPDGNCFYQKVGERNIIDYVGSFANGCSLKSILDRCSLMPVRDKIAYLNQRVEGVGADLTAMPKDGTEAHIMIQKVKKLCPDFAKRLKNGESFEALIKQLFPQQETPVSEPSKDVNIKEGENNG